MKDEYYLAIGGSRHGKTLERFGEAYVTFVAKPRTITSLEELSAALESEEGRERYTMRFYRLDRGVRHATYFVLDNLSGEEALRLINELEDEGEAAEIT